MRKTKSEKVCVVVVSYNDENIFECVKEIQKTDYSNFFIVIVDNNSNFEYKKKLEKLGNVQIVFNEKNFGYTRAINIGIIRAIKVNVKYVGVVSNDILVTKNWLKEAVKILKRNDLNQLVGFNFNPNYIDEYNYVGSASIGKVEKFQKFKEKYYDKAYFETEKQLGGACFVIKRKLVELIGFLDEDFFVYGEESDFQYRIREQGYLTFASFVPVFHISKNKVFSQKRIEFAIFHQYRAMLLFSKKHDHRFRYLWMFIILFYTSLFHKKNNERILDHERRICYYENPIVSFWIAFKATKSVLLNQRIELEN